MQKIVTLLLYPVVLSVLNCVTAAPEIKVGFASPLSPSPASIHSVAEKEESLAGNLLCPMAVHG